MAEALILDALVFCVFGYHYRGYLRLAHPSATMSSWISFFLHTADDSCIYAPGVRQSTDLQNRKCIPNYSSSSMPPLLAAVALDNQPSSSGLFFLYDHWFCYGIVTLILASNSYFCFFGCRDWTVFGKLHRYESLPFSFYKLWDCHASFCSLLRCFSTLPRPSKAIRSALSSYSLMRFSATYS